MEFRSIGVVRSPYSDKAQIPKGPGAEHQAEGVLELLPEFEPGLVDIEGFSHLYVLWVFHRAEPFELLSTPPTDDQPHGVFATRAPRRPNPIGLTVVRLLRRDGPRLHVRGLDMLDGTPILDIKPYLSSVPADEISRGWLADAEARGHTQGRSPQSGPPPGTAGSGATMPFIDVSTLPQREVIPGYRARFLHGQGMTAAYWEVDAGAAMPEHAHIHEQIANVLSGEFELTVAGERRRLAPGTAALIPSNVRHSGRAITACRLLDVFTPVREDYR